jgi:hypothetical protein
MKVAVLNFSGNVGKSTLAAHMLAPRMGATRIFSVESLNVDAGGEGVDVERVRGKRFAELLDEVMLADTAIVDVGASNAEDFMRGMKMLGGSHEEFDAFVIPTVSSSKQIVDTLNTARALAELGVPGERIRILFNRVEEGDKVQDDFSEIFAVSIESRAFRAAPEAVVYANEVFGRLKSAGLSLAQICADTTPWRQRMRSGATPSEVDHAMGMLQIKRMSGGAKANLDAAYDALFA